MDERQETRRLVINSLIPTTAYANLQTSAKSQLLDIADMLVNYIFDGKPSEEVAKPESDEPAKVKRKRRKKSADAPLENAEQEPIGPRLDKPQN